MTVSIPVRSPRRTSYVSRRSVAGRLSRPDRRTTTEVCEPRVRRGPGEVVAVRAVIADVGFDVRWSVAASTCTVAVTGEVDNLFAPLLGGCLLDVLDRRDFRAVVVDLSGTTFFSAAGLRALAAADQKADDAGRVLRIRCGTAPAVLRLLEIAGLTSVFTLIE